MNNFVFARCCTPNQPVALHPVTNSLFCFVSSRAYAIWIVAIYRGGHSCWLYPGISPNYHVLTPDGLRNIHCLLQWLLVHHQCHSYLQWKYSKRECILHTHASFVYSTQLAKLLDG